MSSIQKDTNEIEFNQKEFENQNHNDNKNDSKKDKVKKEIISWVKTIACAVILVIILQNFVIINASVPTESMVATIHPGDKLITLRLSYLFSSPKRGDVVVLKYPDDESQMFTKRIIGLPGEKVEIIDGLVYINDSETPLNEPYVYGKPTGNYGPYYVPEDSYLVLGDNRQNSLDSRFWNNTYVKENKILGKILFRYYPSFEWISHDIVY